MAHQIRGFIFDWDDTCQDTGRYWVRAHQAVMRSYGIDEAEIGDVEILSHFGNIHFALKFGIDKFRTPADVDTAGRPLSDTQVADRVFDEVERVVSDELRHVRMDPELRRAMQALHDQGKRLAVFSSSPAKLLNLSVEANGLEDLLDIVVSKDDAGHGRHKPHPYGIELCLQAMNSKLAKGQPPITPDEVLMIGDSWNDVIAGKNAGVHTLKLVHPLHDALQQKSWDAAVADMTARGDQRALSEYIAARTPDVTIRLYDAPGGYEEGHDSMHLRSNYRELVQFLLSEASQKEMIAA